jgi:hypothetical protein
MAKAIGEYLNITDPNFLSEYKGKYLLDWENKKYYQVTENGVIEDTHDTEWWRKNIIRKKRLKNIPPLFNSRQMQSKNSRCS